MKEKEGEAYCDEVDNWRRVRFNTVQRSALKKTEAGEWDGLGGHVQLQHGANLTAFVLILSRDGSRPK